MKNYKYFAKYLDWDLQIYNEDLISYCKHKLGFDYKIKVTTTVIYVTKVDP